ncbi:MAG: uroporphyrinogen-III synthase [Proteobacteria bacterium]|nr:uroporphyrinogen-III synthase [Pseudomonadota bacterium]MYJ96827.1 uroporphyrinogen-III synthase [Pseudomonadota bacterium]
MDRMTGQRVLITRAAEDCAAWASRLADAGAVPLMLPCIECHPIREPNVRARLAEALPKTDWLVLTSRRGAETLRQMINAIDWSPADKKVMAAIRIAAVGPATAAAAASLPGQVELVAPSGTARSLAEALATRLRAHPAGDPLHAKPRYLIAVAENAGNILEKTLEQAGGECMRLDVYRTQPAAPATPKQALSELGADKILLASPSAVTGLVNRIELDAAAEILTIGPSTTRAAHTAGLTVTAEAAKPSLDGLMEAMQ